jgi:hypothetical protein
MEGGAAVTERAGPTESAGSQAAKPKLGVLFVHGIGEQQQYSTLARFGGALQRWLGHWNEPPDEGGKPDGDKPDGDDGASRVAPPQVVDVLRVEAHPERGVPANARVAVTDDREWLLAEAWWAPEVTPPKFKEFIRWVLPMFPWLAAEYAVAAGSRVYRPDPPPSVHGRDPSRWERGSLAGLVWLASPLIAVVLMVVCLVLAVLQRLPVVGKRVSSLTVNLVKGVGDSYLFAHDALARTAMVQRIRSDLAWLRAQGCERVAIVAHSQGAALSHDMLRANDRPAKVDLLVTVGSGVQRLNGFRELYRNAKLRSIGWWSIAAMVALAAGIVLVAGALGPGVPGLWAWPGIVLVVVGVLYPGFYRRSAAAAKALGTTVNEARLNRPAGWTGVVIASLGAVALMVAGLLGAGPSGPRLFAGGLLLLVGIVGYGLAYLRVDHQVEGVPPKLALPPGSVTSWVDYFSTADPVPNGPLVTWTEGDWPGKDPRAVHPEPRLVHNLRSVQGDHSFYFDNADEFLSQLAIDLTKTADGRLDQLSDRRQLLRQRAGRRWRTSCRSDLRNLLLGAGLLGALAVSLRLGGGGGWRGLGVDLGVQNQPPHGLIGQLAQWVLDWLSRLPFLGSLDTVDLQTFSGVLVAAVAVAAGAMTLGWLWSIWDRHAMIGFFERHRTGKPGPGGVAAVLRRAPTVLYFALAGTLLTGTAAVAQRYGGAWWLWPTFLAAGAFTAVLEVMRWRTCFGPPKGGSEPPPSADQEEERPEPSGQEPLVPA